LGPDKDHYLRVPGDSVGPKWGANWELHQVGSAFRVIIRPSNNTSEEGRYIGHQFERL